MTTRDNRFQVTVRGPLSSGRVVIAPVRRSRVKLVSCILGTLLALGPALWAAARYAEMRDHNYASPVGASESDEQVSILPGTALADRDGETVPAVTDEDGELNVDLGELSGGSSKVFEDLLRIRNEGAEPILVYVDVFGLSDAPLHAAPSGDAAPGAFSIESGEERSVDLGMAVDIVAESGDVAGEFVVRTASALTRHVLGAEASIVGPSVEAVLATLTGALENPRSGLGKLGDLADGLEAPRFEVDGVWDGGTYNTDVHLSWRPVGPLTDARASINGRAIGSAATVRDEGTWLLRLEAKVLGVVPFSQEIGFSIDRTAPTLILVSPPITPSNATFAVKAEDASPIAYVDLVLLHRPEPKPEEPDADQAPAPSSSPTPSPSSSPDPSSSPSPKASSSPEATPSPSPTPRTKTKATPSPEREPEPEPIRVRASYDQASGLWIAKADLEPGSYLVWVESADVLGNTRGTNPQSVRVVSVWPADMPLPRPGV